MRSLLLLLAFPGVLAAQAATYPPAELIRSALADVRARPGETHIRVIDSQG